MYTDPGLVSLIIAAVAGGFLSIPFFFKNLRYRVKEWFNAKRKKQL